MAQTIEIIGKLLFVVFLLLSLDLVHFPYLAGGELAVLIENLADF